MDKLLTQFIEVAIFKNVSYAANKLHLSQPTLTHNMKKLEARFGVQLFERSSSGVTLTEYGELLFEQSQMMQRIYENTLSKIDLIKVKQEQSLRIGTGHAWWELFVKSVFETYKQTYPNVNIHVDVGNHLRLMDLLIGGEIDLFIGHEIKGLSPKVGITFTPLFSSSEASFVRKHHPLADTIASEIDLENYPIVELTPDEVRYRHLIEELHPKRKSQGLLRLTEQVRYSTNSMVSAIDMLNGSDAILLSYPLSMGPYFLGHDIVPLRLEKSRPKGMIGIYMIREKMEAVHIQQITGLIEGKIKHIINQLI